MNLIVKCYRYSEDYDKRCNLFLHLDCSSWWCFKLNLYIYNLSYSFISIIFNSIIIKLYVFKHFYR